MAREIIIYIYVVEDIQTHSFELQIENVPSRDTQCIAIEHASQEHMYHRDASVICTRFSGTCLREREWRKNEL